ncbi:MAG: hypothetical protein CL524_01085 [Aequorivita sp.]|jgi:hypothetical protein|nr:hypothetical protein [Aequorivita sp.]|tara:strand:+ start:541 stop:792 length:252 start_codon:yes stop_codon:yes gene_type:complete
MKNIFASIFLLLIGSLFFAAIVCAYDLIERFHGSEFANFWIIIFILLNTAGYTKIAETVFSKVTINKNKKKARVRSQSWKNKD